MEALLAVGDGKASVVVVALLPVDPEVVVLLLDFGLFLFPGSKNLHTTDSYWYGSYFSPLMVFSSPSKELVELLFSSFSELCVSLFEMDDVATTGAEFWTV